MNVIEIPLFNLSVSDFNVRKTMTGDEDEANIHDLANDIAANGLLNPLTVRQINDITFEVIAGQRRYMALKFLGRTTAPCNVLSVDNQKAEELSLVENVQRNQMTSCDKVRAYSRLYEVYDKNINTVVSAVHITKKTIEKYIKIRTLPEEIIERLDKIGDEKITLDVAIELSKIDITKVKDLILFCNQIQSLNTSAKINAIKRFLQEDYEINIADIVTNIICEQNNVKCIPTCPYVINEKGEYIIIPEKLYKPIIELINMCVL